MAARLVQSHRDLSRCPLTHPRNGQLQSAPRFSPLPQLAMMVHPEETAEYKKVVNKTVVVGEGFTSDCVTSDSPQDYGEILSELQSMVDEAKDEGINLKEFFGRLQSSGFALMSLVLALPFLQPVPLGPFGTLAGISLIALGLQMRRGRKFPILPKRLLGANIRGKVMAWPLRFSIRVLVFFRRFTRPRLQYLVAGAEGRRRCGLLIATGGLLMCAPFVGIPCNNMFPALIAFFAALAELEQDGLLIWVAVGWLVVSILFFAALTVGILLLGAEALQWFKLLLL